MSKGINKVTLVGFVGEEPQLNQFNGNSSVARFPLATSENYTDKEGNTVEKTEWHKIVVWNKLAEVAKKYIKKGERLYVEGKIRTNSWEDKEGNKRYSTEIFCDNFQFLSSKKE